MNELLKEMGQRILERRKQLNMTQETLANLTHLTSQTISYAEMGQKAMRPETMLKICEALGTAQTIYCVVKFLKQTLRCSSRRFPH